MTKNKLTQHLSYNITKVKELYLDSDLEELKYNFNIERINSLNNSFLKEWRDKLYNVNSLSFLDNILFLAQLLKDSVVNIEVIGNLLYINVAESGYRSIIKGYIKENNYIHIMTVEDD